jgi:hypothetical protein
VLESAHAHADLGSDLTRVRRALATQTQAETLRLRLLERGEIMPLALPPWALDTNRGECTTLVLLAPVPTHFVLHVHPWPSAQSTYFSSAGAVQLTRCGRERATLLKVLVEMRSPRAVLHTLVAVGADAPAALTETLPERDAGAPAPAGEPGPALPREPLAERLRRFEVLARESGATSVETRLLPARGYVRLSLEPGCHRLLASSERDREPYQLLLQEPEQSRPDRLDASDDGDVSHELCTARPRSLLVSVEAQTETDRQLSLAHSPLPQGLPGRFGPQAAEQLLRALGASAAPKKLGPLVFASLGAQGRTPLPRSLLPRFCYLAVVAAIHGQTSALSLGVQAGASSGESTSAEGKPGPRVGFCTGKDAQVELDVEARGLGVAWLFGLFQVGPAAVESP